MSSFYSEFLKTTLFQGNSVRIPWNSMELLGERNSRKSFREVVSPFVPLLAFIFIFNKSANCRFKNFYVDVDFAQILDIQYWKSIDPPLCTYKSLKEYKIICLFREAPKTSLGGGLPLS